jgi:hypothetical protein
MSDITSALPVNMKTFKKLLASVSPDIAVCVRGRHAVGKSEGVYQAAAQMRCEEYKDPEFCAKMVESFHGGTTGVKHADGYKTVWTYDDGVPVMERRLSQMTEGDTIGMPFVTDDGRATMFKSCDWLITSCDFPVVLFLDERNRALDGVKQSIFQLCDSKAFYGNRCHPNTRVVIAENVGDQYQVQQCDPAELSRCATVLLEPSEKEWLDYAAGKCDLATIEFIRDNSGKLEHTGQCEPNKKYQDRRSWFKFDQDAQRQGLFDEPENPLFRAMACSMLGVEIGNLFTTFCKERERQVSAKDIIKNWEKAKKRIKGTGEVSNSMYIECVGKLGDLMDTHTLTNDEAAEIGKFMHDCPMEIVMTTWAAMQKNTANLFKVHPYIEKLMVRTARCQERGELKAPSTEEVEKNKKAEKKKAKAEKTEADLEVTEEPVAVEEGAAKAVTKKRGAHKQ